MRRKPPLQVEQIEFIRTVFYQMTRAYLVGRISGQGWMLPFVLALQEHRERRAASTR